MECKISNPSFKKTRLNRLENVLSSGCSAINSSLSEKLNVAHKNSNSLVTNAPAPQSYSIFNEVVNSNLNDDTEIIPLKIINVYKELASVLAKYSQKKLPLAASMLPDLNFWQKLIAYTKPDNWSYKALQQITNIFLSKSEIRLQPYYQLVLYPRLLKELKNANRVHPIFYDTLIASGKYPRLFFLYLLLPLLTQETCSFKLVTIVCSILSKCTITDAIRGSIIIKLTTLNEQNSKLFYTLIQLLNKSGSLPSVCLRKIIEFIESSYNPDLELYNTVLWWQFVLTFLQRWRSSLMDDDIDFFLDLSSKCNNTGIKKSLFAQLRQNDSSCS